MIYGTGERVAVVTGASSGFGQRVCELLVADGYLVYGVARDEEKLEAIHDQVGDTFIPKVCDVSDREQVESAGLDMLHNYPSINVLVNSAGMGLRRRTDRTSYDDLEALLRTNFLGTYNVTRALLPGLINGKADIMNVTSAGAAIANPASAGYTASKAALGSWNRSFARDMSKYEVRVHDIRPGNADTPGHPYTPSGSWMSRHTSTDVETVARAIVGEIGQPSGELYIPSFLKVVAILGMVAPNFITAKVDEHRSDK